ncbi:MAG: hypothetical protein P8Y68_20220 [Anaerolineales bacterium]
MDPIVTIIITLALVFYSIGVWSERIQGKLKLWHLVFAVHAVWATVVLVQKDENAINNFHRFSVAVWVIWLIPYFSPMFFAIGGA